MCLCLCMYDFENWLASIYYTICFFRIINLPRCACTCSVQFGFISFYVMLYCAVKKQLFHFLTIHKAVLYKRFCGSAPHIILLCNDSSYSKDRPKTRERRRRGRKKDVIALGHSTFELAKHSTFIDLQAYTVSQRTHMGTFYATKIYQHFSLVRKYNFHLF